ncbi:MULTISPECIES: CaiB/BaiF CoA-transferase family protein [Delftia]|jgi:crotonobetainyl-CoA:carnitine CoA-transferase CaiB-like acyl-CoA transferase|uniref:CaiB/BaiF CoA transferase family protein n=1 Tax=Delftia TaxID=80865 RepID=UPI000B48D777|nr:MULTISPECIES: CaiB/BaiF CoA-transferase family protein [Delftia]MBJ2141235.1 CoA transferase [Delftia acidovorans]MCA1069508.1 Acetyl-CoA:oxalate CoA-transferase [Delftia acidovorans]OWG13494.1 CoA transferase [Delftia sp. K82]WAT85859.1 CaiB/BaiF CoA-transferase family protein [Delftia acidovorans]SOE39366.1 Crotonobetainyl-CoA:carnitine CoA-transferase CaiB [Delftia acidovorans]
MTQQRLRPLDGTTVVSLEHAVAAPFCTRQLADLGARVIKVERPGSGDFARGYDQRVQGQSSHFTWINRSKQSLALDLKQDEAMQALLQLLEGADVLVQNLAPGAAARMGLSYAALRERFPRLIVCDISGYGADGPYRDKKAYDLLIQSEAGFLSVTGTPEVPSKAGISVADIAAGMYAYTNILSALLLRGRTGEGSHIDVSMLEALGEWMGYPMYYAFDGAPPPPRTGASHASIYPYGPFEAGDGGTVMLGLQNEREWKLFCEQVLLQPALAADARFDSNARRNANREELRALILGVFNALDAAQVVQRLDAAGIANARVNDMAGLWAHPQLAARQRWCSVDTPAGPVQALLPPGANSAFDYRMEAVPAVGEHSAAILAELGWSAERISALCPPPGKTAP